MVKFTVTKKVVVLDAGHGGKDSGAIGLTGLEEKEVNLLLCYLLKERITKLGYEVIMTRYADDDTGLGQRTETANRDKEHTIAFISVHCNSFSTSEPHGTETYYHPKSVIGKILARSIQAELVHSLGTMDRGIKISPPGWKWFSKIMCPAVLVEVAFISNPREEGLLKSTDYLIKAADAITEGFKSFFREAV